MAGKATRAFLCVVMRGVDHAPAIGQCSCGPGGPCVLQRPRGCTLRTRAECADNPIEPSWHARSYPPGTPGGPITVLKLLRRHPQGIPATAVPAALLALAVTPVGALAHGMVAGDKGFVHEHSGVFLSAFAYLGAKHMVTGYDHLLFLIGVVFFLHRLKDVATYVTLFAVGHSLTLIAGVMFGVRANPHLVDAVIGLSVAYKALENLDAFRTWFGRQPDTRIATFVFGLCHGFGLATRLQDLDVSSDGLLWNLLAFNVGVEIGQVLALGTILLFINHWRRTPRFLHDARGANVAIMAAGIVLMGSQIVGFVRTTL